MKIEKTYSFRQKCLDADTVKAFSKSRFDTERDKTYPCMFSSMFLIKNYQQRHSLKSQNKKLKFVWGIRKSIINNKWQTKKQISVKEKMNCKFCKFMYIKYILNGSCRYVYIKNLHENSFNKFLCFSHLKKYKTCHCDILRVLSKDLAYQSQMFFQSLLTIQ